MDKPSHPLRAWRKKNGLTLTVLAERLDVTSSHLSEIENWNNEPSLDLVWRLHLATGLSMKSFVKTERAS
jgi:transcriptional regulator with XRE-family HTH domain